jgi:hypothetical protein
LVTNSEYTPATDLSANTKYYWRVRAYNTSGHYSNWSAVLSFRTALLPPTPGNPIDGMNTHTNRPDFDWVSVTGASNYTLQISKNNTFTMIVNTATVMTSNYTPAVDLPRNMTLYWRVRANGANPSAFSATRSFSTGNSPSTPVLLSPANNVLSPTNTPVLQWKLVTLGAGTTFDHFQLQVADDPAFGSPLVDDTGLTTNSLTNTLTVSPALTAGTTYYWRVRAFETLGDVSGWSSVWKIRTPFPAPVLSFPVGGGSSGGLRPAFDWSDVSGASGYTLQVSKNNTFSLLVLNQTFAGGSAYTPAANLPSGLTLYWRVRANGLYGPGTWSTFATFHTP